MSAPEDELSARVWRLQRFEAGMDEELVRLSMSGYEPPLDAAVVRAAAKRVKIRWVLEMARGDERWVLAWLLGRYLNTVTPASELVRLRID